MRARKKSTRFVLRNTPKWAIFSLLVVLVIGFVTCLGLYWSTRSNDSYVDNTAAANNNLAPSTSSTPMMQSEAKETETTTSPKTHNPEPEVKTINPEQQLSEAKATPKPIPEPEVLRVEKVMISGDAFCDNDNIYKLAIQWAYIYTNARKGNLKWQIESRESGVLSVVASGTIKLAEGEGAYDFFVNNRYYIPAKGSSSYIRMRVTSPNTLSSQWISPSEVLSSGSPCAIH